MNKFTIKNFKAFGDEVAVLGCDSTVGQPMNILCYGENGAGKSSVYEAIKYVFHRNRIEKEKIPAHLIGQPRDNAARQILIDYGNKLTGTPPDITINNHSYSSFNTADYYVYMIDGDNLRVDNQIDVRSLLKSMYLGPHDIDQELTTDFLNTIIDETNRVLKVFFYENVQISQSQNGHFLLKLSDNAQNLVFDSDLKLHFNEAKLHLIILIVALSSIILMAPSQTDKKKILVLDDFITSLDTANRTFLYQYLMSSFNLFQIIIFTHNTSFYNLCDHFLKENPQFDKLWLRQGIYEYNNRHYIYSKNNSNRLDVIEKELAEHPERIHDIGNDLRQYFEVLLHQLSQLLMAGAKEETSHLIKEISEKSNNRVFHVDENGISDLRKLFENINSIMTNAPETEQWKKVKSAIENFNDTNNTADKLSENVQAMAIFQKVALHQSSHGHSGLPNFSAKEIKASIFVLRKIEKTIKNMTIERV